MPTQPPELPADGAQAQTRASSRFHAWAHRISARLGLKRDWWLIALGAAVGMVTALGAIAFVGMLHWAEDGAQRLAVSWPWWTLPLLPMAGALATGLLVHRFAREARGHGVPEVMDAIYTRGGKIRPRVAIVKAIASACTIGSGGSAGAEGPIVQIGSAIGSGVAQALRISREQVGTLLGCGAAAGIASVFNAPIAGVFFVLEILLRDFSLRTFTPIMVASVFSAVLTQHVLGANEAIFAVPGEGANYQFTFAEMPSYLVLGLLCGMVAVGFIRLLYKTEDLTDKLKVHPVGKPVVGAAMLGLLGIGYLGLRALAGGESTLPPFFGNGYPVIMSLLDPAFYAMGVDGGRAIDAALWMLALLVVFKAVATCMTLGFGGSGGVFAPSLFLGASAGATFGAALDRVGLLPPGASPAEYALVGMAAVVAGTTHAPLTAILIVWEITRDQYVVLPLMLASIVSVMIAQYVFRDSIYSVKLRRRGVITGTAADFSILRRLIVRDTRLVPHVEVRPEDPALKLLDLHRSRRAFDFVVIDEDGRYLGMVTGYDLRTALIDREILPMLIVGDLLRPELPAVDPDDPLDVVLDKFNRHEVQCLTVAPRSGVNSGRPIGLITRGGLMQRHQEALASS